MIEKIKELLNEYDSSVSIENYIDSNEKKDLFFEIINQAASEIKLGKTTDEIVDRLKAEEQINAEFITFFKKNLLNNVAPFLETSFLRDENLKKFQEVVEYIVNHALLSREGKSDFYKNSPYDKEKTEILQKFVNTINGFIIAERSSYDYFLKKAKDFFELDKERIDYLWTLFNDNKPELYQAMIIDKLRRIEKAVDGIYNIFDEMMSIDDEENLE